MDDADINKRNWKEAFKEYHSHQDQVAPETVEAVGRLTYDLTASAKLFDSEVPSKRLIRGKSIFRALY